MFLNYYKTQNYSFMEIIQLWKESIACNVLNDALQDVYDFYVVFVAIGFFNISNQLHVCKETCYIY